MLMYVFVYVGVLFKVLAHTLYYGFIFHWKTIS